MCRKDFQQDGATPVTPSTTQRPLQQLQQPETHISVDISVQEIQRMLNEILLTTQRITDQNQSSQQVHSRPTAPPVTPPSSPTNTQQQQQQQRRPLTRNQKIMQLACVLCFLGFLFFFIFKFMG